jgi:WD40 repeat protein
VVSQKRVLVREMVVKTSCVQTKLSPDGTTLACYDVEGTLWLFGTADNDPIVEKKNFFHPTEFGIYLIRLAATIDSDEAASANSDSEAPFLFVNLGFSPDGKYFLAGSVLLAGDASKAFAYDLSAKREASVGRGVRQAISGQFVFLGNDRIAAVDMRYAIKSPVVSFPSGEKLEELPLATETHLLASSDGKYLIAGPARDFALWLIEVKTRNSRARLKFDAADVYNGVLISELADGTLALNDLASAKTIASMTLQESRLGFSADVIVSPDFKWLAASTRSRGAMWDLTANTRTHSVRGFRSGWFADDGSLYADFPKSGEQARAIVQVDARRGSPTRIACSLSNVEASQFGRYLLITTPEKKGSDKNWTFELHDLSNKNTVWSHHFPQEYPATVWDTEASKVLVRWSTSESAAKEELKQYPEWKTPARNADFLFEVIDFHQNKIVGKLLLNTNRNSFKITNNTFDGDWIAITTNDGSVLTYSLISGQEIAHVFGYSPALSAAGKLLVVTQSERILDLYDLASTELRAQYKFSDSVVYRAFSSDGHRLFVLTSDQTAYILDLAVTASPAATSVASTASN